MRKLKLFVYDHAPGHVHDTIPEYRDTVPFSKDGIRRWCEIVGPTEAELFYCGQYTDENRWMLRSERFGHFRVETEERHVFDLEGDQSHLSFMPWMRHSIITAMNAEPNHRNWSCFVRPGCSKLLMALVEDPPPLSLPKRHGFYFRGQRDPHGVRERLRLAVQESGVDHLFEFTDNWNAPTPANHADVLRYRHEMAEWSMALCPSGSGQMSVRYFEACAFDRAPIVVADNLLFEDGSIRTIKLRLASVEVMARCLHNIACNAQGVVHAAAQARAMFSTGVKPYFDDPTLYLLGRLQYRGQLDGTEWANEQARRASVYMEATK
jgi:hypothetical protein